MTIVSGLGHRIALALLRDFDPDELQHLHGGYSVERGLHPYIDYFEHHAPWFAKSASWLVSSLGTQWETLMAARVLSGALSIATLITVAALAAESCGAWIAARAPQGAIPRQTRVRFAALTAAIAYATNLTQLDKAIEIRPDVPATFFFVIALRMFLQGLRNTGKKSALRPQALAGLLLGCGFMLTPKLAFAAIGLGLGTLLTAALARDHARRLLTGLTVFTGASLLPFLVTVAALAAQGRLEPFLRDVIIGPLGWAREISPGVHLLILLERNPLHAIAGSLGCLWMVISALRLRDRIGAAPDLLILPCAAAMITVGWFTVPVPWPQFLLPLWPIFAVTTAAALDPLRRPQHLILAGAVTLACLAALIFTTDLSGRWAKEALLPLIFIFPAAALTALTAAIATQRKHLSAAISIAALGLAAYGAYTIQPHAAYYGPLWLLAAALPLLVPAEHRAAGVALAAIVAVPLVPLGRMISERPIEGFRAEFEWIMDETGPDEEVLTGWRGCAVFRPHAYRYYFLHPGMLQMLSPDQLGPDALAAIQETQPAAVIRDKAVRGLDSSVQRYLDEHYAPTGVGDIWARR